MLGGMAAVPPAPPSGPAGGRPACWFPLALFGVIVALPVPLYAARLAAAPGAVGWVAYAPLTRTVSWSFSGSSLFAVFHSGGGLLGIAGGWYWAAALTAGFVLTAVWYWRAGGRTGAGPCAGRAGARGPGTRRGARGFPRCPSGPVAAANASVRGSSHVSCLGTSLPRAGQEGLEPPTPGFGDRCSTN